jgi:AcrR family transcriptional regulator
MTAGNGTGAGELEPTPDPPWRGRPRRSAPRTVLTRELIVSAAGRVLDRDGLDQFNMRAVSEELGTGPGSLYWHVRSKEELLDLVLDEIFFGELDLPAVDALRWVEQLEEMADQVRAVGQRHRDIARVAFGRAFAGPHYVTCLEWLISLLRAAHIPETMLALSAETLTLYLAAFMVEEKSVRLAGEVATLEEAQRMVMDYYSTLPADRFPNVRALCTSAVPTVDDRFRFGLKVFISGLVAFRDESLPPKKVQRGGRPTILNQ